jgi:hypothetical protein
MEPVALRHPSGPPRYVNNWIALLSLEFERRSSDTRELHAQLLQTIRDVWPEDPNDWWLPPTVETSLPKVD